MLSRNVSIGMRLKSFLGKNVIGTGAFSEEFSVEILMEFPQQIRGGMHGVLSRTGYREINR